MQNSREKLENWLANHQLDQELRLELEAITKDEEIYDRFYKELEFGTGGLRGILGAGTNRMNILTVGKATQGFADYINRHYTDPSIAIAYDSRTKSDIFAEEAANILMANGIKVHIYKELMPTPALSFAVRYFKCVAGIMVTASHNPAKYNGYKVYNDEGCQLTLDAAAEVFSCIEKTDAFKDVKHTNGLPEYIEEEVVKRFLNAVKGETTGAIGVENLSVVFTPLNGTGNKPVRKILEMIGIKDVKIVKEQELPDGNFPTCPYPNPEKKEALKLGLELCQKLMEEGKGPDLLLATDPDCDRVGIAVKNNSQYKLITGNEVGVLLLDFICQRRIAAKAGDDLTVKDCKKMPEKPIAVKTIVSSKMADQVAANYGVEMRNVLTGFKFIGEQIKKLEDKGAEDSYIFGFEESYGYLSGSYVRDKDAVNGAMLICEMVAYYKKEEKTLVDRLNELYNDYGYYGDDLIDFAFEGAAGMEKMAGIMAGFRADPPVAVINKKVLEIADYSLASKRFLAGCCDNMAAGTKPIDLPKSDVLEYVLDDGSSFMVRPSGTEPKLKIYLSAKGKDENEAIKIIEDLKIELTEKICELSEKIKTSKDLI